LQGNDLYKKRNFTEALGFYQKAIDRDPEDLTCYSNKAAVNFEMNDYDKCVEAWYEGIIATKKGTNDV